MTKKYHVYAMGNALVDAVYKVEDQFITNHKIEKGVMTLIDEDRQTSLMSDLHRLKGEWTPGGSAANTVIASSQYGARGFYSCRVANDDFGTFFSKGMNDLGVDLSVDGKELPSGVTGKCLVMVTDDADRTMNTFLGVSAEFSEAELDYESLKDSEYLYVEGYLVTSDNAFNACVKAIRFAKENGVKVSLTLSDPAIVKFFKAKFLELISEGVDLLFANEEELAELSKDSYESDSKTSYDWIQGKVNAYAITQGANGASVWDGQNTSQIPGVAVDAIDTNGAGDMFAGAFLSALYKDSSFEQAGHFACLAASEVVTKMRPRLNIDEAKAIHTKFYTK